MILPAAKFCEADPFLNMCRNNDLAGYLNPKKGANKKQLIKRRINYSLDLLLKHLQRNKELQIGDFASGTGTFGLKLAELGYQVDFVDNEAKFFDYIKLKADNMNRLDFITSDVNNFAALMPDKKYSAIFFGEAIEHMENPGETLKRLREYLLNGGILVLTTPNGDFVNSQEPNWEEVKDQKERNKKLANNHCNHVCELGQKELATLVKNAGFGILEHRLCGSDQLSRRSLLRRILPAKILDQLDDMWSNKSNSVGKKWGRTQIIVAQRVH